MVWRALWWKDGLGTSPEGTVEGEKDLFPEKQSSVGKAQPELRPGHPELTQVMLLTVWSRMGKE